MNGPASRARATAACAMLAIVVAPATVRAGAWMPEEGEGTVVVGYQFSHVQNHLDPNGDQVDVGSIDSHNMFLRLDYGITGKFALNMSVPYVIKRYKGARKHAIEDGDGDLDLSQEDNGNWHGEWQDLNLGLQYRSGWGHWAITPYAAYGNPTNDYEHFAHAATGANQKFLELGVDVGRVLPAPFERVFVQLGYGYSFLEKFNNVDVDRSVLRLETGYLAGDRLMLRVFAVGQKSHGGLDFPDDYAYTRGDRTPEEIGLYYHHDQTQRVDYIEIGAGGAYDLGPQTQLFASYLQTLWGENGHETDRAWTMGLSRSF